MRKIFGAFLMIPFLFASATLAQTIADPALLAEINRIRAIDNHAHPSPLLGVGEKDPENDVPDSIPPEFLPVRLRDNNPEYLAAWRFFYGYPYNDFSEAHMRELKELKQRARREKGDGYPAWVLDRLNIETMFANRFALGRGLIAPRFRHVLFVTPFLFPLDNAAAKKSNPQREADFTANEQWLKNFLAEAGLAKLPATLDDYVNKLMIPLLAKRKREGVIAVKIYAAYLRSLDFADAPEQDAARIYRQYAGTQTPAPPADYKILQDYLFRRLALECGRLGLAVHIHTGAGAGGWFYNSTASPFLLDSVLNDPQLRATKFVLLHGGLPQAQATRFLLDKENVYADFSSEGFLTSTRELSGVIRSWLEFIPEKVLFGTDAYDSTARVGWEETAYLTNKSARLALAIALTGMLKDGEITRRRASELARMVLRENAINLYGLKPLGGNYSQIIFAFGLNDLLKNFSAGKISGTLLVGI